MPKGLKQSSSLITISQSTSTPVDPLAAQFLSKRVDLQLNPLDNEVFVVTGLKIDFDNPIALPDTSAVGQKPMTQKLSVSTNAQTVYAGIESSNVIGASMIDSQASVQTGPAIEYFFALEQNSMDAPPASMDYLAIIATNDFHINFNVSSLYAAGQTVGASVRLFGYRATADSSTYASLVQSELLSA